MIPIFHLHRPRNLFLSRFYVLIIFLFFSTPLYMEATRVQPMVTASTIGSPYFSSSKMERNPDIKLRKLPHVFSKVLELPCKSDADVAVEEGPDFFRFVADIKVAAGNVRAHAVEIHPGVIKIVVRNDKKVRGGGDVELLLDKLEVDTWRFRLPSSTQPELTTAAFMNGKLIVTVPKGGAWWGFVKGGVVWRGGSRLVLVQ